MEKQAINKSEFALAQQALQKEVAGWTDEIGILNQRIREAKTLLEKLKNLTDGSQQNGYSTDDSALQTIVSIFKESNAELLSSSYIRSQYRLRTGEELNRGLLLDYMKNSNGVSFQMEGKNRFARWRMIVNHS